MAARTRLELTWIGKDTELEPRIVVVTRLAVATSEG